jgi:hypothetical protein
MEFCNDLQEFPQYEAIPYAGAYECPECGGNSLLFGTDVPKLVGWCSTPRGYMMVFECQECFTKFRYHNCDHTYDWETFKYQLLQKKSVGI